MKILIAVTHLLGIGHLARMRLLARGLVDGGHDVTLVSGGRPQPHLEHHGYEVVQLPPVHCMGTDFSTLYQEDGGLLSTETRAARRDVLTKTCLRFGPDLILTETFPFGRRALKEEFLALCETTAAMRPRPAIVASIRDILNPPSTPAKAQDAEDCIGRFYDGVLVHGDSALVPPEAGWPFGPNGARALRMTGYIDESDTRVPNEESHGAIVVSGGGSAASLPLYRAALDAALIVTEHRWHMLIGHGVAQSDFDALARAAPPHMIVERARKDFRALLKGASLSVSQAGYNTIVDLFDAGLRMVLVPFAAGQEQEQTLRAEALATRKIARLVREVDLSGNHLAQAVRDAFSLPVPERLAIARDGVRGSLSALNDIHQARSAIESAWLNLEKVLARMRHNGEMLDVWWRDDDAVAPSAALARLLALARDMHAPLGLAVIPQGATVALADALAGSDCDVLIHGIGHHNHAPANVKKQELGYRPADQIAADLRHGLARLQTLFGKRALPVLVPPWNRIDPALLPILPECGIRALSTFKHRAAPIAAPGVLQVNTHCDPIAWKNGGGLAPESALVMQIAGLVDTLVRQPPNLREPLGLLTHHLVHDEAVWAFMRRLLTTFGESGAVRFVPARVVFDVHQTVSAAAVVE